MEMVFFGRENATPPLLLVHGAGCDAKIWGRNFTPALSAQGFWGAAISLPGRSGDGGEGTVATGFLGLNDYVEAIHEGAQAFARPPIGVGHSMGGYLIQKYALEEQLAGQVLLAAPSLDGFSGSVQHIIAHQSSAWVRGGMSLALGAFGVMAGFRSLATVACGTLNAFSDSIVSVPGLNIESPRALLEALVPDLRCPSEKPPTLVIGGTRDAVIPPSDIEKAARHWDGEATMVNADHNLMLGMQSARVLDVMTRWLTQTFNPAPV